MTGPDRGRVTVIVVVGALVAAALIGQDPRPPAARAAPLADAVPGVTNRSAAWYCAAGSGGATGGLADETIVMANAARHPVRAAVQVFPGGQKPAIVRVVDVAPRSQSAVRIADIAPGSDAGVVVETFGGDIAVEHVLDTARDFAIGPCTRSAAEQWYFAYGTTARDSKEVLSVFNPFGDDAVIDVAFATPDGVKRPPSLRAVTVPARSRITIAPSDHVTRQDDVAAFLRARRGRVVAERTLSFDGSNGRSGFSLALGAVSPTAHAAFAEGLTQDGVSESLIVFNPADTDSSVAVRVHLDNDQVLPPQEVALAGRATEVIDIGAKVPAGVGHSIEVDTADGAVVVERLVQSKPPAPRTGIELSAPRDRPSARWLFAVGQADTARDEWITIWNPGRSDVPVNVFVLAAGQLLVPEKLRDLRVGAGKRVVVRLGDSLQRTDTAVLVDADAPVYAERGLYGIGFALGFGLPYSR